jgi:two-component system, sporulation sensor kinase B
MDLMTKDLLVNFLFILLSLFLVQLFYMIKYTYRMEELKGWVLGIFPVVSLVLCMLFPVAFDMGFVWDLRWIPFILGGLYGGYRLGLLLLFLVLSIRYYQGADMGFYLTAVTFSLVGFAVFTLSKYYLRMKLKQKIMLSCSISIFALMCSILFSKLIFETNLETSFWLQYITIHIVGMFISTLLWEIIVINFNVLQKLVKTEKLQMVSHLAASISHEVRNPLTVSRGFIQMLAKDISTQSRKEYAAIALQELDRATEIINDYLTFAKPALEKLETINVNEEIQHAVSVITPLATMNNVEIQLSLMNQEHYFVKGEKKKFQQCLINILKNGIESMPNHGKLKIQQSYRNLTLKIDIEDEGTGMTQDQIDRLGEPYFSTKEKGTGLGMMVSYSIIKGMNGNISVTSEYGKGTCFTIKLPVSQ